MRLEHQRRESIWELSVLAAALQISPVLLIYPLGLAEQAEYLLGRPAGPFGVARWRGGEICVTAQGDMAPGERRHPAALFRDHHQVLAEVPGQLTGAAYRLARRAQPRPGGAGVGREGMLAVIALWEIRESIRDGGLQPPPLPRELAWIDDPDS